MRNTNGRPFVTEESKTEPSFTSVPVSVGEKARESRCQNIRARVEVPEYSCSRNEQLTMHGQLVALLWVVEAITRRDYLSSDAHLQEQVLGRGVQRGLSAVGRTFCLLRKGRVS